MHATGESLTAQQNMAADYAATRWSRSSVKELGGCEISLKADKPKEPTDATRLKAGEETADFLDADDRPIGSSGLAFVTRRMLPVI